jgi:hypothetical protein
MAKGAKELKDQGSNSQPSSRVFFAKKPWLWFKAESCVRLVISKTMRLNPTV